MQLSDIKKGLVVQSLRTGNIYTVISRNVWMYTDKNGNVLGKQSFYHMPLLAGINEGNYIILKKQ